VLKTTCCIARCQAQTRLSGRNTAVCLTASPLHFDDIVLVQALVQDVDIAVEVDIDTVVVEAASTVPRLVDWEDTLLEAVRSLLAVGIRNLAEAVHRVLAAGHMPVQAGVDHRPSRPRQAVVEERHMGSQRAAAA
jgi:hypothetical protein